jgi:hypothetical protein
MCKLKQNNYDFSYFPIQISRTGQCEPRNERVRVQSGPGLSPTDSCQSNRRQPVAWFTKFTYLHAHCMSHVIVIMEWTEEDKALLLIKCYIAPAM